MDVVEEERDIKKEITTRFIDTIEYLIKSGKINSYRDFEGITNIANQRLSFMKSFVYKKQDQPAYVNVDYIYLLVENFQVSLDWLFFGVGEMMAGVKDSVQASSDSKDDAYGNGNGKISEMEKRIDRLEHELKTMHEEMKSLKNRIF